jgi:hypothetical protein
MEATHAMPSFAQISVVPGPAVISVAIIDPDDERRKEVAGALAEFLGTVVHEQDSFPADLEDLPQILDRHYNAILIGLDSDPEYAFDVVESLCADKSVSVMAYSAQTRLELAIRFMRAGAREFLTLPLLHADVAGDTPFVVAYSGDYYDSVTKASAVYAVEVDSASGYGVVFYPNGQISVGSLSSSGGIEGRDAIQVAGQVSFSMTIAPTSSLSSSASQPISIPIFSCQHSAVIAKR